jgi:sorbitol-specific phosphotransferase system component IIA
MEEHMEQQAKRIGKFNIIDILAVLLILVVAVFLGMKLLNRGSGETVETAMTKVTYTVRVEGVPSELYENCLAHLPSPLMASGALVGGQIESVESQPYYVLGADGQWVEDPEHVTLYFTATTTTPTTEVMTTKVRDQEVRIGKKDYILKSEYIEFKEGTIVDVQWEAE